MKWYRTATRYSKTGTAVCMLEPIEAEIRPQMDEIEYESCLVFIDHYDTEAAAQAWIDEVRGGTGLQDQGKGGGDTFQR